MNELRVLAEAHLSDLSLGNPEISGFPGIYLRRGRECRSTQLTVERSSDDLPR
jgi:hypothetical protein